MTPPHAQHTPHHHEHGTHIHHGRRYDRFATVLFGGRRRHIFTQLAARSGARPGDRVLDIGCGTGYLTRVMARAVAPDGDVIGIDSSPEVIDHARRLTHQPNCTYTEGTATALDATDKSVDVVVSSLMIHHLPDSTRSDAIHEMYRVIRPEGHVLVAEFRPPSTRIGQSLVSPFVSTAMTHNPIRQLEPMIHDAGFQHVRSGDLHPWIRYVYALKPATA
jgi:ubiquinone/menaquinone biosynthesis C-methylase UbiE